MLVLGAKEIVQVHVHLLVLKYALELVPRLVVQLVSQDVLGALEGALHPVQVVQERVLSNAQVVVLVTVRLDALDVKEVAAEDVHLAQMAVVQDAPVLVEAVVALVVEQIVQQHVDLHAQLHAQDVHQHVLVVVLRQQHQFKKEKED